MPCFCLMAPGASAGYPLRLRYLVCPCKTPDPLGPCCAFLTGTEAPACVSAECRGAGALALLRALGLLPKDTLGPGLC